MAHREAKGGDVEHGRNHLDPFHPALTPHPTTPNWTMAYVCIQDIFQGSQCEVRSVRARLGAGEPIPDGGEMAAARVATCIIVDGRVWPYLLGLSLEENERRS